MALQNSWPGPSWLTTTTAARKNLAGLLETDSSGNPRVGVFASHFNALVTARADLNVDIAAFQAVTVQFGGPILLSNDGTIQLPSPLVSPGSGTNYYVIYVKQNESTSPGTDANNSVLAAATLSTTSFALARAALPAGAFEIATVQMPTGKTATNASGVTITPTFLYTAAEGGVVPVRDATELAAWTPADGSIAFNIAAAAHYRRAAGAWMRMDGLAVPSSATNGTVNPDGSVSFSGVASVSLNGVFTSAAENYRVVIDVDSASAAVYYRLRLRAAGSDITSAAYAEMYQIMPTSTPLTDYSLVRDSMILGYADNTSLSKSHTEYEISGPAKAGHSWTPVQGRSVGQERMVVLGGGLRQSTICDGFTVYPTTGTFSGRIRVYALPGA